METTTPKQNGVENRAAKTAATVNLTHEQSVVKNHEGLDSLPGYVLVIFEKSAKGGAIFSRLVRSGERFPPGFRIPFFDWAQKYFSVAVNDTVLSYTFNHTVTLDDGTEEFVLSFHLKYRVADARRVAEIWAHDPLRQLRDEAARVIGRNCAKRKAEMFRKRFRELEKVVINDESAHLSTHATTLGLKIISISLDAPLPDYHRQVIDQRNRAAAEKSRFEIDQDVTGFKRTASRKVAQELNIENVHHKYDVQKVELQRQLDLNTELDEVHRNQQTRRLRDMQTDAIGQAITNVGANIDTPDALLQGFDAARQISQGMQTNPPGSSSSGTLPPGVEPLAIGSGDDRLSSLLVQGLREIDRWKYTFAQQQALRSALLHIVAEALLDDHADEKVLKQYTNQLSELGKNFQPPLGRTQRLFLEKFLNFDELKNTLR
jgi:hypothetical protein